jgi:hypothetical protein
MALLVGALVDLVLSYNYFLSNPEVFLSTEVNTEFINFVEQGDFPVNNLMKFIVAFPLLLFILCWFDVLHDNLASKSMCYVERCGRFFTVAIPGLFCISYSVSGMTWYTNSEILYEILSFLQTITHGFIMLVFSLLFLLTFFLFCDQQKTL